MNRRGFLSLLGLGGYGLLLGDAFPGLVVTPKVAPLVVPATSMLMTPEWVMNEMAVSFRESLGSYEIKYVPCKVGAQLGDRIGGHLIDTQRYSRSEWASLDVPMGKVADADAVRELHIKPFAALLAQDVKSQDLRVMSDLRTDIYGAARVTRVSSPSDGISLRGAWQYDIGRDCDSFQVHYIGGHA